MLLARPALERTSQQLAVLAVLDRSQSIPADLHQAAVGYLTRAADRMGPTDQLGVVDVAEGADVARLPSGDPNIPRRNVHLPGRQSVLADGVQMAMAIAPPSAARRIVLISDGNETEGDLRATAAVAAANDTPIDVLPVRYRHEREVIVRRVSVPPRARLGQTVTVRTVVESTAESTGRLVIHHNGRPIDLAPGSPETSAKLRLGEGTNVHVAQVPLDVKGLHEFTSTFVPDGPAGDRLAENNQADAVTYISGPGHVLLVDAARNDQPRRDSSWLAEALAEAKMSVRQIDASAFPRELGRLMEADAVVLVNTDNSLFSQRQQELLRRYVTDLGGGLVMVGGPDAYGAGGWIGSPLAEIMPVDMDPPQKKQLPKGALALVMHACEMPRGNYWGKKVAVASVNVLSRRDLVGVLAYQWQAQDERNWVYKLAPAGDKADVIAAIQNMSMGDMPDFHAPMKQAYDALVASDAAQKHMIIISDGDPAPPSAQLLRDMRTAGISCSGACVFPHDPSYGQTMRKIAQYTGGRFRMVDSPSGVAKLPQFFVKEAQVVRRALIVEETVRPQAAYHQVLAGIDRLPPLEGYVLTGTKGGLNQVVLAREDGDPILAVGQAGVGRCVAFTSSADSRWAEAWLGWGGMTRFWEQTIRWAARSAQGSDCDVYADVQGRTVTVTAEALDREGQFVPMARLSGQVVAPDMSADRLEMRQVGPGQFRATFRADQPGSYLVNLRYRRADTGAEAGVQAVVSVPYAPEFEDLEDNAPLLAEVARMTGGRLLATDPNAADLFLREGLTFPTASRPLLRPLLIAWVVAFLLDVALRRIVVDFRAAWRGVVRSARSIGRRSKGPADASIDRLQKRRRAVHEQLSARAMAQRDRRYEAGDGSASLPDGDADAGDRRGPADTKPDETQTPPADEISQEKSSLDRLLDAKRKARDQRDHDRQ
jgi:uncharacterized membrane protein